MKKSPGSAKKQKSASPVQAVASISSGTEGRQLGIAAGILIVAVLAAFGGALSHDFVYWDDQLYVFENPLVMNPSWENFLLLGKKVVFFNYHPLTMWSLWANVKLFGPGPQSFLATNLLLHAANAVLALLLAWQLSGKRLYVALITAALFALSPLRVESVAWVAERKDVLYVLFFLAGCLAYLRYTATEKGKWLAGAGVLMLLSCLSKGQAVVFPLVCLLFDYWNKRPWSMRLFTEKAPMFALSLLFGLIALNTQHGGKFYGLLQAADDTRQQTLASDLYSGVQIFQFAGYSWLMYWFKSLVPVGLCPNYFYPQPGAPLGAIFWLGPFVLVGSLALAIFSAKRNRLLAFSIGFFFITVVLVLQFISFGRMLMADRFAYLPSLGLYFLLAYGLEAVLFREKPALQRAWWGAAALLAVVFLIVSRQQVHVWRDTESLWLAVLEQYPNEDAPLEALGTSYGKKNRIADAEKYLERAVSDGCTIPEAWSSLGSCYMMDARKAAAAGTGTANLYTEKALNAFKKAIELDPKDPKHRYNRALALSDSDPKTALSDIDAATPFLKPEQKPHFSVLRGVVLNNLGDYPGAVQELNGAIAALERTPGTTAKAQQQVMQDLFAACLNRGLARNALGDKSGAIADVQRSLQIMPDNPLATSFLKKFQEGNAQ